jgi:2-desacetyl-2-hydroxyethyl bacteriochlorophyllide A dehydrogenase
LIVASNYYPKGCKNKMKACVLTNWKKLELMEMAIPIPKPNQVLIKVIYAGVCGSDVNVFNHNHPTATIPRIMCHEILGTIEEINSEHSLPVGIGSRVVVFPLTWCGTCEACREGNFHVCRNLSIMGLHTNGGFAEYVCANADNVFSIPPEMPDEIAILTEPFAVGFHAHMRAGTQPGDEVLVIGAGPIGLLTAITARYFGAKKVVVSELNPERIQLVRKFGFDVINPTEADLVAESLRVTGGIGFDKVFEASGSQNACALVADVCKIRGKIVPVGIPKGLAGFKAVSIILKEISMIGCRVYSWDHFKRTFGMLEKLFGDNEYDLAKLIDRILPIEKLAEAIEIQGSGKNNGKILMEILDSNLNGGV